jgi:hypothetical protein
MDLRDVLLHAHPPNSTALCRSVAGAKLLAAGRRRDGHGRLRRKRQGPGNRGSATSQQRPPSLGCPTDPHCQARQHRGSGRARASKVKDGRSPSRGGDGPWK